MAKDHASNTEVKRFAQMMIDDHTKAGAELKQIASAHAIPQDAAMDQKHKNLMDKLSKLNAKDFDKEYINAMVDDHEDAVRDLRSRVDENRSLTDRINGKNPENPAAVTPEKSSNPVDASLNQWAANVLPTVEQHLDRAKQIKETLDQANGTARETSGKAYKGGSKY
jgi:putative membrane protein